MKGKSDKIPSVQNAWSPFFLFLSILHYLFLSVSLALFMNILSLFYPKPLEKHLTALSRTEGINNLYYLASKVAEGEKTRTNCPSKGQHQRQIENLKENKTF